MRFEIGFYGHPNVRSLHRTTIEITRERRLGVRGDCIIGVGADCGCAGVPEELKKALRDPDHTVRFSVLVGGRAFELSGRGHADLTLAHQDDIVLRKSGFVCPRTIAVGCDRASDDIPRGMVRLLQDPGRRGVLRIEADCGRRAAERPLTGSSGRKMPGA